MQIAFIELQNFRKLKAVHIDFAPTTTVMVGANNSGKTSAMVALGLFFKNQERFSLNDFTLSTLAQINKIGAAWESNPELATNGPNVAEWADVVPALDIWLSVTTEELQYVSHLLPSLEWVGGNLGVRLRLEPEDITQLYKDYLAALKAARTTKKSAQDQDEEKAQNYTLILWPRNLNEFLERRLNSYFKIEAYLLDPAACKKPVGGVAKPQSLPPGSEPLERDPFEGLIRVDEIDAQRGFSDRHAGAKDAEQRDRQVKQKLTDQLRSYYQKHLDPSDLPEPQDLEALQAIDNAQASFDERLKVAFEKALREVEELGYPGVTDPRLTISTKIRPTDGLDHNAAVQYEVKSQGEAGTAVALKLPEEYNGLGYQNLISIVFRLMSFRDSWMQVGKAAKRAAEGQAKDFLLPPLHLVLVEEPEAHLHAQVQQVFIRKAYDVLRNHPDLGQKPQLHTQLVVSTHSSHVAHECEFASLRYFRRLPAQSIGDVPTSTVVNLSEVFGEDTDTAKFAKRYLKSTHCDLFFADAAILIEGAAERILVPHFISTAHQFLYSRYITLLEIGGSHAHILRPLIEHLGLISLVITDLDSSDSTGKSVRPERGKELATSNPTLKSWLPQKTMLDDLFAATSSEKISKDAELFAVRIAYQCPVKVSVNDVQGEAIPYTFEDALVLENIALFSNLSGGGLVGQIRNAVSSAKDPQELSSSLFPLIRKGDKAGFALELLYHQAPEALHTPTYIAEGLGWLSDELKYRQLETSPVVSADLAGAEATA